MKNIQYGTEFLDQLKDRVHDLYDENVKLKEEIERLKEEYMMLQNASDEVEEEKDREIERLNNIINDLEQRKILAKEIERLNNIINDLEQRLYNNTDYEEYDRVEKDTFNYVIKKIEELRNKEK